MTMLGGFGYLAFLFGSISLQLFTMKFYPGAGSKLFFTKVSLDVSIFWNDDVECMERRGGYVYGIYL